MDTNINSNFIRPNAAIQADPGWLVAQAGKVESTVLVEDGSRRFVCLSGDFVWSGFDREQAVEIDRLNDTKKDSIKFVFQRPSSLQNVTSLKTTRIIIYGVPEADGVRPKYTPSTGSLSSGGPTSSSLTQQRKRYIFDKNALYVRVAGVLHTLPVFEYDSVHWLTIEELLDAVQTRLQTFLLTLDPAAVSFVQIGTSGYIELVWQCATPISLDIASSYVKNNIFAVLHELFYVHNFLQGQAVPSEGLTNASILQMTPTSGAVRGTSVIHGSAVVTFASQELTAFMTNSNVVQGDSSSCFAIGTLYQEGQIADPLGDSLLASHIWDFNANGRGNLVASKMAFDVTKTQDTFYVQVSFGLKEQEKLFEVVISEYLPTHRIKMLLFFDIY